jgi:hypothetical protein
MQPNDVDNVRALSKAVLGVAPSVKAVFTSVQRFGHPNRVFGSHRMEVLSGFLIGHVRYRENLGVVPTLSVRWFVVDPYVRRHHPRALRDVVQHLVHSFSPLKVELRLPTHAYELHAAVRDAAWGLAALGSPQEYEDSDRAPAFRWFELEGPPAGSPPDEAKPVPTRSGGPNHGPSVGGSPFLRSRH